VQSRLSENGLLCLECSPENISQAIGIISESGFKYSICYLFGQNDTIIWLLASKKANPKLPKYLILNDLEQRSDTILNSGQFSSQAVVLLVGDSTLSLVSSLKSKYVYIIAFCDDEILIEIAKSEGISVVTP